jgi:hypothetical protein
MSRPRKQIKKGGDRSRHITVRGARLAEPKLGRLSRAALALAVAQAEADAQAQAADQKPTPPNGQSQ